MGQYAKTFEDYLYLLRRRKYYIIVTWALVSVLSVVVAYSLPKTYRSSATLLFEAPLQTNLIGSSISQFADEQIQSIYQRVMTTENVLSIIGAYGIYEDIKDEYTNHELAEFFKDNAEISLSATSLTPKASSGLAEISFNISFIDNDPVKAKEVAGKLAALFVEQNERSRTQRAIKTSDFLMAESEKLSRELQDIEGKIVKYKEENNFVLPEQTQGNLASIERTENELRDTENQVRITKERITFLGMELARAQEELPAKIDEKTPLSKEDKLRVLKAKYLELSSIYSPSHPSVIRLKREIRTLDPSFEGDVVAAAQALEKLNQAKLELKTLAESYSSKHPAVTNLKNQIDKLQQQIKNSQEGQSTSKPEVRRSTSPAYLGVEAQYKASQSELQALIQKQEYLKQKLEKFRNILMLSPQVEKGYNDLIRARDNTIKKYTQLKERWLDAKLIQTQEEQQISQTLTIIESPEVPIRAEKAVRRKVAIGGFLFGLIAGFGLAFIVDFLDPRLTGYRAIAEVTGLMPIVLIPYIDTPAEEADKLSKHEKQKKMMVLTFSLLFTLAAIAAYYYFTSYIIDN